MSNKIQKIRYKKWLSQNGRCYYCQQETWIANPEDFCQKFNVSRKKALQFECTAEHLLAKSEGGDNCESNIVAACKFCNKARHLYKRVPEPSKYKELVLKRIKCGRWMQL
jgi:hypothetical protein